MRSDGQPSAASGPGKTDARGSCHAGDPGRTRGPASEKGLQGTTPDICIGTAVRASTSGPDPTLAPRHVRHGRQEPRGPKGARPAPTWNGPPPPLQTCKERQQNSVGANTAPGSCRAGAHRAQQLRTKQEMPVGTPSCPPGAGLSTGQKRTTVLGNVFTFVLGKERVPLTVANVQIQTPAPRGCPHEAPKTGGLGQQKPTSSGF